MAPVCGSRQWRSTAALLRTGAIQFRCACGACRTPSAKSALEQRIGIACAYGPSAWHGPHARSGYCARRCSPLSELQDWGTLGRSARRGFKGRANAETVKPYSPAGTHFAHSVAPAGCHPLTNTRYSPVLPLCGGGGGPPGRQRGRCASNDPSASTWPAVWGQSKDGKDAHVIRSCCPRTGH
jgi:hypothetical protein